MKLEKSIGWIGCLAFVAVLLVWAASPWVVKRIVGENGEVGTFGDSFGALTSLFTGLAFVGLIITLRQQKEQIAMQREDLKLQREEMKAARDELSGQKEQMELQNQSLKQQMFEQTFFNLLNVFNQYIADLAEKTSVTGEVPKTGRDQLEVILNKVRKVSSSVRTGEMKENYMGGVAPEYRERTSDERFEVLIDRVPRRMLQHANDLNSYFRLLYNILKTCRSIRC